MELHNVIGFLQSQTKSADYKHHHDSHMNGFKLILKDGRFLELFVPEQFIRDMRDIDRANIQNLGDPLSQFTFIVSYIWNRPGSERIHDMLCEQAYQTERLTGVLPDVIIPTEEEIDATITGVHKAG